MIKDIANCREVHFGNGTTCLGIDTTGKIEIIYNKPKTPVGEPYNEYSGQNTQLLDEKSICIFFDGEDGLKSLDMIIEDLRKIRKTLKEQQ